MKPEPVVKECGTCYHFSGCLGDSDIGMCTLIDKGVAASTVMAVGDEDSCWEGEDDEDD